MISFDYKKATGKTPCKLVVKCTDKELFNQIRENFSVENTGARFARRYSRFAPQRKYVITPTGNCELGLYWSIRQYLIKSQIKTDIEVSPALTKAIKVGINKEMVNDFEFTLRDYQEGLLGRL